MANPFRVLQRHYVALMDMLRWQLTSRAEFERLLAANADTLTDLERAARFLYLQRTAFGGKISGRKFSVAPATPARFDVTKLTAVFDEVHERLAGVVIERLPYAELIARYDRPDTLFYLDPPYWGCERDYGPGVFDRADFERLAELLAGIKGRFLLSLNDTPGVREVFGRFDIETAETTYSISGKAQRAGEVLISG
ncbi:DNA methyltransferase [Pseudoroseomonas deserti]|uniref:DNA methyltransferase n=1 Tax=Teichococcus deserti TaxID=1817963 RepID=A0A1V2H7I0_9PROT|nr:DNA adenine methylase [Pseudoroseomonas deserti]ONG58797.1 DNA methyltransferase [Pseudoroseomonas deserti]